MHICLPTMITRFLRVGRPAPSSKANQCTMVSVGHERAIELARGLASSPSLKAGTWLTELAPRSHNAINADAASIASPRRAVDAGLSCCRYLCHCAVCACTCCIGRIQTLRREPSCGCAH